jgi:hypothetical protein
MRFTTIRKQLGLGCSKSLRDVVFLAVALVLASGWGCATRQDDAQIGESTQACTSVPPVVAPEVVLGFESLNAWRATSGKESLSLVRTQASEALALTSPASETDLTSARLASTAAGLVGIATTGATISLDVMLPAQLAKVKDLGSLQLFVSCPSRKLIEASLGSVNFQGARLGIYRTVKFAVSDKVQRALQGATYTDLTFELRLHAPAKASGAYLFDNMRLGSPATPPPAPAASIDLVATTAYSPAATSPGVANFPVGVVQVPQSFHVNLGSAGTGTATLALGYTNSSVVTCTYVGATGGTSYVLSSCTGGAQAGDLLGADFAQLTIVSGDPTAGTTRIRAQLAENPAGDVTGGNVIPPMPTFWGDSAASANQIATDYFNAANAAPPTEERWIQPPVGDFAKRAGDGHPVDMTQDPPPPNDPPFNYEGHMNSGGAWDASWNYSGSLDKATSGDPDQRRTMNLTYNLTLQAVLFGVPHDFATASTEIDTDSGPVGKTGFDPTVGSASGTMRLFLFGNEVTGSPPLPVIVPDYPGSDSPNALSYSLDVDFPQIYIWIFTITFRAHADVGITVAKSDTRPVFSNTAIAAKITPTATIGASVTGGIDLGIASGGVEANITLLKASLPFTTVGYWVFDDSCNTTFNYTLTPDPNTTIGALGGEIDLVAQFGICPFCDHESWTIYKWAPLVDYPYSLPGKAGGEPSPLPTGFCWQCTPNTDSCIDSTTNVHCNTVGQLLPPSTCVNGCQDGLGCNPLCASPGSDSCNGNSESDHCDESGKVTATHCDCPCANNICPSIQTDDNNCGGCDNVCASGQHCSGGQCVCDGISCPHGCCAGSACQGSAVQNDSMCGDVGCACEACNPDNIVSGKQCVADGMGGKVCDCPPNHIWTAEYGCI